MNELRFSREEWEHITGSDESANFTYQLFDEDEGIREEEVVGDNAQVRVFIEPDRMNVSSHGFGPHMESGHGIYQQPDGWCEINEWVVNGEYFNEIRKSIGQ